MNEQHRPIHISQFISSGTWAHKDSPFAKLNLGFSSIEPADNVLSSGWLWRALGQMDFKHRFAMGFPDEWNSFCQAARSSGLLAQCSLDLWVFRSLSLKEQQDLNQVLTQRIDFRLILAVTHLSDGETLVQNESFQGFFHSHRAFLSFLPPGQEADPFLKPQEVLWKLQEMPRHIPVLIQDFPQSKPSFFRSLKSEDWALEIQSQDSLFISILKVYDRLGFGHFILFLESFLSFFLGKKVSQLSRAMGYLFQLNPWCHKFKKLWVLLWHRTMIRLLNFAWYRLTWRALNFIWYQIFCRSLLFLWFRLIWKPADFIWNVGIKKNSIWLWHKMIWPTMSFVWYKIISSSWVFLRYRLFNFLLFVFYPLRKVYWIASHEYDKRVRYGKRSHES